MSLSVLKIGEGFEAFGLYDSQTESFILTGSQDELFIWKDAIERKEQEEANKAHLRALRKKYLHTLTSAGNSHQEAETFLKQQIPGLFKEPT